MPRKDKVILNISLTFPKTPKKAKDRRELFRKFKFALQQESLPFEEVKFDKVSMTATTKKLFLHVSFKKPISALILVREPEENIEKMNVAFNKLAGYLNTILGEIVSGGKVSALSEFVLEGKTALIRKLYDKSALENIGKRLTVTPEPLAIGLKYKLQGRENVILSIDVKEEESTAVVSVHVLKINIPADLVVAEKNELVKLQEFIKGIVESGG